MTNDQDAKRDAGKPRLTLVPRRMLTGIARVREYAVDNKYHDPENYRKVEVERYRDSMFRHLVAYLDDPYGNDEESGLPHLWHLATNVCFLCELEPIDMTITYRQKGDDTAMQITDNEICGTCKWHQFESDSGWVCGNPESDCCSCWTEFNDSCYDWEEREETTGGW